MLAILNGDREAMTLNMLMWADTYRGAVRGEARSRAANVSGVCAAVSLMTEPEPLWKQLRKARPLRLVVNREPYYTVTGYGKKCLWYRETLSCNHTFNWMADLFGEKPPKRRRCLRCAEEKLAKAA